jgi:hypothetical protein
MALNVLHQRTIEPARQAVEQLPKQPNDLNNDYSQLLTASKEISVRMGHFRKEFRLQKHNYQLPSQSKIFSYLSE